MSQAACCGIKIYFTCLINHQILLKSRHILTTICISLLAMSLLMNGFCKSIWKTLWNQGHGPCLRSYYTIYLIYTLQKEIKQETPSNSNIKQELHEQKETHKTSKTTTGAFFLNWCHFQKNNRERPTKQLRFSPENPELISEQDRRYLGWPTYQGVRRLGGKSPVK